MAWLGALGSLECVKSVFCDHVCDLFVLALTLAARHFFVHVFVSYFKVA